MLDILAFLDETAVPNVLMGLGALMLMLSLVDRRVAVMLGGLFLLLGAGISLAPGPVPFPERSPPPATSPSPAEPASTRSRSEEVSPPAHVAQSRPPKASGPAGPERGATGCTAKFTDLELDPTAASDGAVADSLYDGFLATLMPSVEFLPCATRHFSSRPLAPRAVAASGGRAETDALRVLAGGGVASLERTYGSECSRTPSKDEVPLARVRVLKFDSVAAGAAWVTLSWEARADAQQVSETPGRRTAWLHASCGNAPAAIFWREDRAGNVVIEITLYTAAENFADRLLEKYSQVLIEEITRRILLGAEASSRGKSNGDTCSISC